MNSLTMNTASVFFPSLLFYFLNKTNKERLIGYDLSSSITEPHVYHS